MADGQGGGIKGIGVVVTADASQIKKVWNEAIQGFKNQTIDVTIEAKEGKSFERIFGALRNQTVEIGVVLKPNRQTIRDFKRDFNERLEREGGVRTPIKAKGLTQREGVVIRQDIERSIGSPIVTLLLDWKWRNGPPPSEFMGTVTGGGGGGGAGGGEAWGPFRPPPGGPTATQDVSAFIRQEVARRMGQGTTGAGQGTDGPPAPQRPARQPRKPHRFDQGAAETQEEWTARLLAEHAKNTAKLTSTSTDVVRRANNRIVQLEKRLGIESGREQAPVPGRTQTRLGPKEVRIEPAADRPGPQRTADGVLLSDAIADGLKEARRSGALTGPTPGTTAHARLQLQQAMGIKMGAGGIEDLGQLASLAPGARAQNALMERINERIFGIDEPEQRTGFRGGGRATRSAFSGQEAMFEYVGTPGPSSRINARKSRQLVETSDAIGAFLDEIEGGSRLDFRQDAEQFAEFKRRWSAGETGWGEGFKRAQEFLAKGEDVKAIFGERQFDPETGTFQLTHEGAFEGALPARAQLDALARGRKLPGVGAAAVRYAMAPTRDDIPAGKLTQEGLDYNAQRSALSGLIDTFFEKRRVAGEVAKASYAGQDAAATVAEALKPPVRPTVPRRGAGETIEQYRIRKAETLEPYNAAVERFTQRQTKLMPGMNDPTLMQYPHVGTVPRMGGTPGVQEGILPMTGSILTREVAEGAARTAYSGVGAFSPWRPPAGMMPSAAVEPDIPDLSDLGFSRDDVLRALSEPSAAAGGVVPPPVPPGTVSGGGRAGGGPEWGGGVVPVRVTNWPAGFDGESMAASSVAMPPPAEYEKLFQTATQQGFEDAMNKLGWKPRQEAEPGEKKTKPEKEPKPEKNPDDIFERAAGSMGLRTAVNLGPRFGLPPIGAEELAGIRARTGLDLPRGVEREGDPLSKAIEESAERARVGIEVSPARAVATAAGQIASNLPFLGGRSKMLERGREAASATAVARAIGDQRQELEAAILVQEHYLAQLPEGSKRHKDLGNSLDANRQKLKAVGSAYTAAAGEAIKLNRGVASATDVMRSFTAGVAGTITGQILFGAVLGGAQAIVGGLTQALGPVIERQMGFKNAAAATTNEIAAQTAQTGAQTEALVDQRLAAANMTKASADRIGQLITERTELMAGNRQIEEQTKLFAAAADIAQSNRTGLGERGGGRTRRGSDINLYESTGGIFNTSFFAPQQSTQEALGNLFSEAGREMRAEQMARLARRTAQDPMAQREMMSRAALARGTRAGLGAGGSQSIVGAILGEGPGLSAEQVAGAAVAIPDRIPAALEDFEGALQAANEELSLHVAQTAEDREKVREFADALDRADMQGFAQGVRSSGIFVEGLGGLSAEAQERTVTAAAENYARGVARRDPAQLIEGMADQISAAVQGAFETARIERQLVIPAQRGLANLANPVVPFSGVDIQGAARGGAFRGTDIGTMMDAIGGRAGIAPEAQPEFQRAAMSNLRARGRQNLAERREMTALDELFQPLGEGVQQEYMEIRSNIQRIGSDLAELQQTQVNIQVKLQTDQFDEQLRQIRRGLADARERATGVDAGGNEGAGANLGLLERQGLMLSRQAANVGFQQQQLGLQSQALQLQNALLGRRGQLLSFQSTELGFQSKQLGFQATALSLAQNQRQINFQVAAAGFTAPGLTGEERAARIREAELEADVAQKQQDIAVSQFGIEQQQFGIEQQQYGIAQAQFALDSQQIAIQQQSLGLAQQQYALSVAQFQNQQAIIDAQNARAVEDLSIQERLVEAAKIATQELAANEQTIANLRRELEAEMQMAGSYLTQAAGVATTIASVSTQLISQFGGDLGKMVTAYANSWISFRNRVTMTEAQRYSANPETQYVNRTFEAAGAVGMVSSPTNMVVGDAGGEMVAILRNPKPVAAGMVTGGGGGGVQLFAPITITGNTIRADDEQEIQRLATSLTRIIEQRLGMRANMFGFGGAGR